MEERDALTTEDAVDPQSQPDDSPMGRLRELRRKSRQSDHLTLEVPGYEEELGIRYKAVPRLELKKVYGEKEDDIDLLVHLCESAVVKGANDEYEALEDDAGPVRFDKRLADYLEIAIPGKAPARETVEGVFSLDLYPLAASTHVKTLLKWMEGAEIKSREGLLGE